MELLILLSCFVYLSQAFPTNFYPRNGPFGSPPYLSHGLATPFRRHMFHEMEQPLVGPPQYEQRWSPPDQRFNPYNVPVPNIPFNHQPDRFSSPGDNYAHFSRDGAFGSASSSSGGLTGPHPNAPPYPHFPPFPIRRRPPMLHGPPGGAMAPPSIYSVQDNKSPPPEYGVQDNEVPNPYPYYIPPERSGATEQPLTSTAAQARNSTEDIISSTFGQLTSIGTEKLEETSQPQTTGASSGTSTLRPEETPRQETTPNIKLDGTTGNMAENDLAGTTADSNDIMDDGKKVTTLSSKFSPEDVKKHKA